MLWPKGGQWEDVKLFVKELPVFDKDGPWYTQRHVSMADGTADRGGLNHHQGCALSHVLAVLDARRRNVPVMVIAESDGLPSYFARSVGHPGSPGEFESVVRALLQETPAGWDLIQLDHGTAGARGLVKTMANRSGWSSAFNIYRWYGLRQAGAALYMVSGRFIQ